VLPQAAWGDSVSEHQRLIANPSLAFLMWLISFVAIRHAVIEHKLGLFFIGLLLTMVPLLLGQFHCLDCGSTGWALRGARHFCPSVAARCQGLRLSRIRVPRLRTQFQVWICVAVLVLLVYGILVGYRG
jgi:hypothetical protein